MNRIKISPEDDYEHPPSEDPLWREGYYFNGYDPENKIGISVKMEIRPVLGIRQELVSIQGESPLLFLNARKLETTNALLSGSLKGEPVIPLKKWKIEMEDTFQKVVNGTPTATAKDVEFNLLFESDIPPCGYTTKEGIRYEQPGFLKGEITIDNDVVPFTGKGLRDHSWGMRDVTIWGEFYMLMGWFNMTPLSFAYMLIDDTLSIVGWLKADDYYEIQTIHIDPYYSGDIIQECTMKVETDKDSLEMKSQLISFFSFSREERGRKIKTTEMLVEFDSGYAFFWHGV